MISILVCRNSSTGVSHAKTVREVYQRVDGEADMWGERTSNVTPLALVLVRSPEPVDNPSLFWTGVKKVAGCSAQPAITLIFQM